MNDTDNCVVCARTAQGLSGCTLLLFVLSSSSETPKLLIEISGILVYFLTRAAPENISAMNDINMTLVFRVSKLSWLH